MDHQNLWAPWRMPYLRGLSDGGSTPEPTDCFLCDAWSILDRDDDLLVLHRVDDAMVIMNRFPYTTGHLMVAPGKHYGDLTEFPETALSGLMRATVLARKLIQVALDPQGVNIGINIGRAAGAGLPGHLHVHVVPRWGGDTNFINVVGNVRVIPQALEETYTQLKAILPKVLDA